MENPTKERKKIKGQYRHPYLLTEKQKAIKQAREARKLAWERKRQLELEMQKVTVIPPKNLTERQLAWIGKNCQPKMLRQIRASARYRFTKWAKPGPMSRSDWVRFFKWADKRAEAKGVPKPHCKIDEGRKKKKKQKYNLSPEEIMEDFEKLSAPKMPRKKHKFPAPEVFPYAPRIHFKQPAKRDRGRPFQPPRVPIVFQHIDVEMDFWSQLRFPIRPQALKYKPSKSILKMSKPRITPPSDPHCPIPPKPVEYVEPRRAMSKSQWRNHQRRLAYLAAPRLRPNVDYGF